MAGTIVANTLNTDTVGGVFTTNNAVTGIAKAWLNYNGTTSTLVSSFNVSSITKNSSGNYTANFTTAMTDANYVVAIGALEGAGTAINAILTYAAGGYTTAPTLKTTTQYRFVASNNGTVTDGYYVSLAVFGN